MPRCILSKYIHIHRCTHRGLTPVTVLVILGFLCRQQRTLIAAMLLLRLFLIVHHHSAHSSLVPRLLSQHACAWLHWSAPLEQCSANVLFIGCGHNRGNLLALPELPEMSHFPSKYNCIIIFFSFTTAVLHYINTARVC